MDKKIIEDWLKNIATPTGISYSGDQTISEDMVEDIVDYVDNLEQQAKKQKEVIEEIKKELLERNILDLLPFDVAEKICYLLKEVSK